MVWSSVIELTGNNPDHHSYHSELLPTRASGITIRRPFHVASVALCLQHAKESTLRGSTFERHRQSLLVILRITCKEVPCGCAWEQEDISCEWRCKSQGAVIRRASARGFCLLGDLGAGMSPSSVLVGCMLIKIGSSLRLAELLGGCRVLLDTGRPYPRVQQEDTGCSVGKGILLLPPLPRAA